MWHLLRTEWANRKYHYLVAVAFPHLSVAYRYSKYTALSTEKNKVLWVLMIQVSIFVGMTIAAIAQGIDDGRSPLQNSTRFHALLPLSLYAQHLIRLLIGPPLIAVFLTIEGTLYLFSLRSLIGDYYWMMIAVGMIAIGCQILVHMLVDFSTDRPSGAWLLDQTGLGFLFGIFYVIPVVAFIIVAIFMWRELYVFDMADALVSALITLSIAVIGMYSFLHRKSFLR